MKHAEWQLFGIVASIIIISLLPVVFISCSDQQRNPVDPSNWDAATDLSAAANDNSLECKIKKSLWAGAKNNDTSKATRVGKVIVKNDATTLKVKYKMKSGYTLKKARVYVGTSPPTTADQGQYPYRSVPLSIPLTTFDASEEGLLYIAAYAKVCSDDDGDDDENDCERAWAGGDNVNDYAFSDEGISKKWGWYFPYVMSCDERARLRRTAADMRAIGMALGSYMVDYGFFPQSPLPVPIGMVLEGYYDGAKKDHWGQLFIYQGYGWNILAEIQDEAECDRAVEPGRECGWRLQCASTGEPCCYCTAPMQGYTLTSYGKDGGPGVGDEFGSDILYVNGTFVAPASLVF
ncbi:MAG: hypothetical protein GY801_37670 [bacterium]|nr:hypothetical protein [bacterium]